MPEYHRLAAVSLQDRIDWLSLIEDRHVRAAYAPQQHANTDPVVAGQLRLIDLPQRQAVEARRQAARPQVTQPLARYVSHRVDMVDQRLHTNINSDANN